MTICPFFRWYDLWTGAYWDRGARKLYMRPLPTIGVALTLDGRCFWRHQWGGWAEHLGRRAIGERYRTCSRCGKVDTGA